MDLLSLPIWDCTVIAEITASEQDFARLRAFLIELRQKSDTVAIIDWGFWLSENQSNKPAQQRWAVVSDHVNLSGINPFKEERKQHFFAMNEIYLPAPEPIRDKVFSCQVAGIASGQKPKLEEISLLSKVGIDAYCYNLIPACLLAAFYNFTVLGILRFDS